MTAPTNQPHDNLSEDRITSKRPYPVPITYISFRTMPKSGDQTCRRRFPWWTVCRNKLKQSVSCVMTFIV